MKRLTLWFCRQWCFRLTLRLLYAASSCDVCVLSGILAIKGLVMLNAFQHFILKVRRWHGFSGKYTQLSRPCMKPLGAS